MTFVIAIPAFRRPDSLRRLLQSVSRAASHAGTWPDLVFFLDGDGSPECARCASMAESFEWRGRKTVMHSPEHLGLRCNVMRCGDASNVAGAVLVLEEDVCVSPTALLYAQQALAFYGTHPQIASISLYSQIYNEFAGIPFVPVDDGSDVYFARTASSWGQIWTSGIWTQFRAWLEASSENDDTGLPGEMRRWPTQSSWKRLFNAFLVARGLYVVYPRFSFSTNMGDAGHHVPRPQSYLTAPLSLRRTQFRFIEPERSLSRYDQYLEIEPWIIQSLSQGLRDHTFDVALTGARAISETRADLVLTTCDTPCRPLLRFGVRHYPLELNCILDEEGEGIGLFERAAISFARFDRPNLLARYFFVQQRPHDR